MRRLGTGWAQSAGALLVAGVLLGGCAAPADLDGEVGAGAPAVAGAPLPAGGTGGSTASGASGGSGWSGGSGGGERIAVVIDTDLGADDLVALAFLLRHPGVEVRAVTVSATGLVGCDAGVDVLGGLVSALEVPAPVVACGPPVEGPGGRAFPDELRAAAARGSGITPRRGVVAPGPESAPELVARLAREEPGVVLVALGPLTTVAAVASRHPADYRRLAAVHAMAGSVAGPPVDGVAEWNAAADPGSLDAVLAGPVDVTLVPEDAVPLGAPLAAAATGSRSVAGDVVEGVVAAGSLPAWWDLATAAAVVSPDAARVETGRWATEASVPGRLVRRGTGSSRVVRGLDRERLEAEYARVFTAG